MTQHVQGHVFSISVLRDFLNQQGKCLVIPPGSGACHCGYPECGVQFKDRQHIAVWSVAVMVHGGGLSHPERHNMAMCTKHEPNSFPESWRLPTLVTGPLDQVYLKVLGALDVRVDQLERKKYEPACA